MARNLWCGNCFLYLELSAARSHLAQSLKACEHNIDIKAKFFLSGECPRLTQRLHKGPPADARTAPCLKLFCAVESHAGLSCHF